jgi:hypothetical protein
MQLKEKTYYKTRDGKKARVLGRREFNGPSPGSFVVEHEDGAIYCHKETGEAGPFLEKRDLISEWKEPVKRYVAWMRDKWSGEARPWAGPPHHTRQQAEQDCRDLKHALLRIDEISYTDEG